MFSRLISYYKSDGIKERLEDFTTEVLAGVLVSNPDFIHDFATGFLNLPDDRYFLSTQSMYVLPDTTNCRPDMVLEGNENLCFIENKINASEGYMQLERYSQALNRHGKNKTTHLRYCTKYSDTKTINCNNFQQYRWYELASYLIKNDLTKNDSLVKQFFNFLEENDMADKLTLGANNFIVFQSLKDTLKKSTTLVDRSRESYNEIFNLKAYDYDPTKQIIEHNRIIKGVENVLNETKYSELLYGIYLGKDPHLVIEVYFSKPHDLHDKIITKATQYDFSEDKTLKFDVIDYSIGSKFGLYKSMSEWLNDDEGDEKIAEWYSVAFNGMKTFIADLEKSDPGMWKIIS